MNDGLGSSEMGMLHRVGEWELGLFLFRAFGRRATFTTSSHLIHRAPTAGESMLIILSHHAGRTIFVHIMSEMNIVRR